MIQMKKLSIIFSACFALLGGCSTAYRVIYWIKGEAGDTPSIRHEQAVAVREAVLKVASEVGFEIKETVGTSTFGILPDFVAGIPKTGLHEPYRTLEGGQPHVWLSVSFTHPFSIAISDIGNASESELVRRLKSRLEAELVNVKPTVSVSFRRDRTRLD